MHQRRLSIRAATTIAVILVGTLFILFSWGAGSYFRQAALLSQTKTLSRIIKIASNQVLHDIQQHAHHLYNMLDEDDALLRALQHYRQGGEAAALLAVLDAPLSKDFPRNRAIKLAQLRIYDRNFNFLLASRRGRQGLAPRLPAFMLDMAHQQQDTGQFKGIGGLWVSSQGPLYSVLLPIGGLQPRGYLELLFDPAINLRLVGEITGMPLQILRIGEALPQANPPIRQSGLLQIAYQLNGDDGKPAYHLTGMADVHQLYQDMHNNQITTTAAFITLTFLTLLVLLLLLNRGIFRPLKQMVQGIERYRGGALDTHIRASGLRELYTLGETFNSMSEQIRQDMNELEHHSQNDGLTGLGNRRYFELRLQEEWARATRHCWPISVLFIDIDHFKRYNDHYGHLQGDDCLCRVAEALQQAVKRDIDVAARYGGEEFVILLPDTDLAGAEQVAHDLQNAIRRLDIEHRGSNVEPFVTLSIGIASHTPQFPEQPEELLHAADTALYQAKKHGRNRISKQATA